MTKDLTLPGPDLPVIDETRLMEEFGGDAEILGELRDLFLEHAPPLFEAIRNALPADDAMTVAREAHSFKGACSTFGAPRLAMICKAFELLAKAGDMETIRDHWDDFETEYHAVCDSLEKVEAT